MNAYLTTSEAAAHIGCTYQHVCLLIRRGILNGEKRGRDWFLQKHDVDAYARSKRHAGRPPGSNTERWKTCIHEAAHAVFGIKAGSKITIVTTFRSHEFVGGVRGERGGDCDICDHGYMAGYAAEEVICEATNWKNVLETRKGGDLCDLLTWASAIDRDEDFTVRDARKIYERCCKLIYFNRALRHAIIEVANLLQAKRVITGEEVNGVVRSSFPGTLKIFEFDKRKYPLRY